MDGPPTGEPSENHVTDYYRLCVQPDSAGAVARTPPHDVPMASIINNQSADAIDNSNIVESAARRAVDVTGLTVVRDRLPVLRDIYLSLSQGDAVALRGPNGAGKSTLLGCIAGIVRPEQGDIRWFGNRASSSLAVRRRIGFAAHEPGLYFELTALENLVFAGRMYGVPDAVRHAIELLTDAGLEAAANRMVGQLSQGMRQRLAIIRAVVHEPDLILLDEPFSGLDADGRDWLERRFQTWRAAGRTVCFASHNPRASDDLAERVISLDNGCIVDIERTRSLSMYFPQGA